MNDRIVINWDAPGKLINKHLYGHFAEHLGHCIYGGFYVGPESPIPNLRGIRQDVVEALRQLNIPNLRWPGGCFADEYHWMDGIGPKETRPTMINTHWGGLTENNHFGCHEFLDLCAQLGCEPYITANLGSGTVQEMSQWVEYLNFDGVSPMAELRRANGREAAFNVRYWGIGNENWGCGGNMTAQFYADQVKRYATYCRNYGENRLYKIACGPNSDDYHWTETLMRELVDCPKGFPANRYIDAISLHYYTVNSNWENKGKATVFTEADYYSMLANAWRIDEIISRHSAIMDYFDPKRQVGLIVDEWGTWHLPEAGTNPGFLFQQNSLRDALVASLHFDVFHQQAGRLVMANIAQTINVLQAMLLVRDDQLVLTPTYHVFEMNKGHQGAWALPIYSFITDDSVASAATNVKTFSVSASRANDASGRLLISLSNFHAERSRRLFIDLRGGSAAKVSGRILTAPTLQSYNDFGQAAVVKPMTFTDFKSQANGLSLELPAHSFITLDCLPV